MIKDWKCERLGSVPICSVTLVIIVLVILIVFVISQYCKSVVVRVFGPLIVDCAAARRTVAKGVYGHGSVTSVMRSMGNWFAGG